MSTEELVKHLERAGFTNREFAQTIFTWPGELETIKEVRNGYGEGSFVVIKATT